MVKIENAGFWSPGKYVQLIKDFNFKVVSCVFGDDFQLTKGTKVLIEECYDCVLREDMLNEDKFTQQQMLNRKLMFAAPSILQYRLKLYGIDFVDRLGFPYYPRTNLFIPEGYKL